MFLLLFRMTRTLEINNVVACAATGDENQLKQPESGIIGWDPSHYWLESFGRYHVGIEPGIFILAIHPPGGDFLSKLKNFKKGREKEEEKKKKVIKHMLKCLFEA